MSWAMNARRQTKPSAAGRSRRRTLNIELLQRRLDAEQARRAAAEQKLEQATLAAQSLSANVTPDAGPANGVSSVRLGRYLEFAVALGYDPAFDPLFAPLHEEVRVAAAYADWQAHHMERVTARRCDLNQSLDEQAFTTGIATRWHLVDHPHRRLGILPTWSRVGLLFDVKSVKYL